MDGNQVDIPALVAAVVRKFDLPMFRNDFKSVPNEEAYCQQFCNIVTHALRNDPTWSVGAQAKADDRSLLDFMLIRKDPSGKVTFRAGIELTASARNQSQSEHARRSYSTNLQLDQSVIVHFTPIEQRKTKLGFFQEGKDKDGNAVRVPVYHLFHKGEQDQYTDFTRAEVVYKPTPETEEPVRVPVFPSFK